PNTQGIGAKVRLRGGAVPMQSQEVISGGRYLAGAEPLLVFAAGNTTNNMTLEVSWRSGRSSVITNVGANRIYEIEEKSVVSGPWSVGSQQRTTDNGQSFFRTSVIGCAISTTKIHSMISNANRCCRADSVNSARA